MLQYAYMKGQPRYLNIFSEIALNLANLFSHHIQKPVDSRVIDALQKVKPETPHRFVQ